MQQEPLDRSSDVNALILLGPRATRPKDGDFSTSSRFDDALHIHSGIDAGAGACAAVSRDGDVTVQGLDVCGDEHT